VKNGFFPLNDQRMARIVTTLKTSNCLHLVGKQINYLAFAFIAPLGTEHYD
jgi:hypothetical protein